MKVNSSIKKSLLLVVIGIFVAMPALALDYDFSGNFSHDNDVLLFNFSVAAPSAVTVFSSSWLYGDPPVGAGPGGFDPMLGIWTSTGNLISFQDDGGTVGSTLSNSVSYNHGTWDSYYIVNLAAGDYIASVTQYDNFNSTDNLSGGFRYDGSPNFTNLYGGGTQPYFNGVWDSNDPRTSYWQFHLLNVASASVTDPNPVPEPTTLLLLGAGLIGLAGYGRKKLN